MPVLDILERDGRLHWDASCLLLSTIMAPDDAELRRQYAAQLRLEKIKLLPNAADFLTKRDYVLARKFEDRNRIKQMMQTRRINSILAGAMLWDLQTAVTAHPQVASKSRIEFTIDRISIAHKKIGSLATIRSAWRQFRPVIHWCAALAYQCRVFGLPFPQRPEVEYIGDLVLADFLALGRIFLGFAREYVDFPVGHRSSFWTTPEIPLATPRHPGWPDAHIARQGVELGREFLVTASDYVIERERVERKWLISGPARRFEIARGRQERP